MPHDTSTLATLIGSRICHDLVSPIGAVTNGLELLELSGLPRSPEFDLIAQSVANANARIRFFRLAFGMASRDQAVGGAELAAILRDLYGGSRFQMAGFPEGSFPRSEIRLVLLAVLCCEQALPMGGELGAEHEGGTWRITARAARQSADQDLWQVLAGGDSQTGLRPETVQFHLLPELAAQEGMKILPQLSEEKAEILITPA